MDCEYCNAPFTPYRNWQRFCSPKCRTANHNNKPSRKQYMTQYRTDNIEQYREYQREYQREYKKTPIGKEIERRSGRSEAGRNRTRKHWHAVRAAGEFDTDAWNQKLKACNYSCMSCGTKQDICIDHIIPVSKGGSNHIDNLQPLCRTCNSRKGNR